MTECPRISLLSCWFPDSHMPHLLSTCEDVAHPGIVNSFLPFPLCDFSLIHTGGVLLSLGPRYLPHLMALSVTHILMLPSVSSWCWWQFCPCAQVNSILSHFRQTPWGSVPGRAENLAMLEPTPPHCPLHPEKSPPSPCPENADFWVQNLVQLHFPWLPKQPVWLVLCWLAGMPREVWTCFTNHWPGSLQHALGRPPLSYVLLTWTLLFQKC